MLAPDAAMFDPDRAATPIAEILRLRRYARILTDDPELADRLVQETLVRARRWHEETAPRTRLFALLRSVYADEAPTVASRETSAPPPSADGASSGDGTRSSPDRSVGPIAQLKRLPLVQREILVLVAVERMSYAEIADLLHMPVATVISHLSQARDALRSSASIAQSAPHGAR